MGISQYTEAPFFRLARSAYVQGGQMAFFRAIFGKCGYFWEPFSRKKLYGYKFNFGYFVAIFENCFL